MRKLAISILGASAFAGAPCAYAGPASVVLYALEQPFNSVKLQAWDFEYAMTSETPQEASGGQVVGYGYSGLEEKDFALLWSGPSGNIVSLDADFAGSYLAYGTDGTQQVGVESYGTSVYAMLWTGAGNQVDLQPSNLSGFNASWANGLCTSQQVGGMTSVTTGDSHAVLWSGSSATAVDLNPSGFTGSEAYGTNGSQQVGDGWGTATGNNLHAVLWSGSANRAVDLNPSGFSWSRAYCVSGNQQVGFGYGSLTGGNDHALLWTGSSASAVDINPTTLGGFTSSIANGTNGIDQVGYGTLADGSENALFWSGTAASAVDLQMLLPSSGIWSTSRADTIDSSGNIYGTADGTFNGVTGTFAVEWSDVPEPATGSLLLIAGAGLLMRRPRTQLA
jgi:hypothetical protein